MTTILLGPQRFSITVRPALESLELPKGPVAFMTAGWEEREDADGELQQHLGGRGRNLHLYQRMLDVVAKDTVLGPAMIAHREAMTELRTYYSLRIEAAMSAILTLHRRSSPHGQRGPAIEAAVAALRDVDTWYRGECKRLYRDLGTRVDPLESPVVGWHRGELAATLRECVAYVVPGGRIDVLLSVIRLFHLHIPPELPVLAWSAGAMAMCDRVLLYHDHATRATSPELLDRGVGRLGGIIALPHARRRLALDDTFRMSVLAQRFPDHRLVLLDEGAQLRFDPPSTPGAARTLPTGARVIAPDGSIEVVSA